jgi:hypothetical protein
MACPLPGQYFLGFLPITETHSIPIPCVIEDTQDRQQTNLDEEASIRLKILNQINTLPLPSNAQSMWFARLARQGCSIPNPFR